jgi:hypothetical protein
VGGRIFISHSCKDLADDPDAALCYARAVRERIKAKLEAQGHTVWLDVDSLVPGDRWRARLHEWLGCCDGAVILFDRTSVQSPWLRKEATILGWRRTLQETLRVVPVFLGDFRSSDLKQYDYGSLDIDANQAARLKPGVLDADALSDLVTDAFAGLATGAADSPMGRWTQRVATLIGGIRDKQCVREAAALLEVDDAELEHFSGCEAAIARQLLHVGLEGALAALSRLEEDMPDEDFEQLAALCTPTWVDGDAAADLQALLDRSPRPAIAVNSDSSDVGREYLSRAACWPLPSRRFVTVSDPAGDGGVEELVPRYENVMRHVLGFPPRKPDALRKYLERKGVEKFVLLTGDAADAEVAGALQTRYPRATFLLLPGLDASGLQASARVVQPALDQERLDDVEDLRFELDQMVNG